MRRTMVVTAALGALLILLATGCGSKKSASSAQTTTSSASSSSSETSTEAMTHEATTTTSSKPSFASTKNCAQLASLAAKVAQSVTPSGNGTVDLGKEADALDALASAAPSEIRGDFHTFADAFKSFAKVYGDAQIKIGQTPSAAQIAKLTAAEQALTTQKVKAAITHLSAWGNSHCSGLSSTSP
jgi:hypothetical protein